MTTKRNLYLVGPMGSGKTAVGRQLARDLGLRFIDTDLEIEKRTGVDIAFIFEKEGEAGFREREADVIAELTQLDGVVLATGGGAVLAEPNRASLAAGGIVVFLDTSVDEQLKRTRSSRDRPLLNTDDDPRAVLTSLREIRQPLYETIADIRIDTTGRRVKSVASLVHRELEERGLFLPLHE